MVPKKLPIMICFSNCPQCGLPSEFKLFECGVGGDFETYVGGVTGNIYRLDLGKIYYLNFSKEELLKTVLELENRLICNPKEVFCKFCKTEFHATNISMHHEEIIEAFEL